MDVTGVIFGSCFYRLCCFRAPDFCLLPVFWTKGETPYPRWIARHRSPVNCRIGKNRIQPGFLSSILASINNALNLKGLGCSPWWAVLLLILYSLFKSGVSLYRSQEQSKENNDFLKIKYRKHAGIWLAWAAILFLVMLVMMKICINLLVLALLVLVTLLLFLRLKEEKSKRKTYQKATQSYPQFVKSWQENLLG